MKRYVQSQGCNSQTRSEGKAKQSKGVCIVDKMLGMAPGVSAHFGKGQAIRRDGRTKVLTVEGM